jgi:hypothetical protein
MQALRERTVKVMLIQLFAIQSKEFVPLTLNRRQDTAVHVLKDIQRILVGIVLEVSE